MATSVMMSRQQRRNALFTPQRQMSDATKIATGQIQAPPTWLGKELPPAGYVFNSRGIILGNCQIYAVSFGKPLYYTASGDTGLTFKYQCTGCFLGGVEISGTRIIEEYFDAETGEMKKRNRTVPPFTVSKRRNCDCKLEPTPFLKYMNGGGKSELLLVYSTNIFLIHKCIIVLCRCDCICHDYFQLTHIRFFVGSDIPEEFRCGVKYGHYKEVIELMKRFCFLTNKKEWRKDKKYRPSRHTKLACPTCNCPNRKCGMLCYKPLTNGRVEITQFAHCLKNCSPHFDENDGSGRILWNGGNVELPGLYKRIMSFRAFHQFNGPGMYRIMLFMCIVVPTANIQTSSFIGSYNFDDDSNSSDDDEFVNHGEDDGDGGRDSVGDSDSVGGGSSGASKNAYFQPQQGNVENDRTMVFDPSLSDKEQYHDGIVGVAGEKESDMEEREEKEMVTASHDQKNIVSIDICHQSKGGIPPLNLSPYFLFCECRKL